jgi:hypothetical protein
LHFLKSALAPSLIRISRMISDLFLYMSSLRLIILLIVAIPALVMIALIACAVWALVAIVSEVAS